MCDHDWSVDGRWTGALVLGCADPLNLVCAACKMAVGIRCGSARASKCEPCATTYRDRVRVVSGSGIVTGVRGLFVTLTAPGAAAHGTVNGDLCSCTPMGGTDLAVWNVTASARFNRFVQELSRKIGCDLVTTDEEGRRRRERGLSYFKAAEVQRRGALHYHVLLKRRDGRPIRISRTLFRRLAIKHGFGHSVDVQRLEPGHASYVAKYVSKAADQRGDVPWFREREVSQLVTEHEEYVNESTGELREVVVGQHRVSRTVVSFDPTYRTWTCARCWGRTMGEVREDQQHWVLVTSALPAWSMHEPRPSWANVVDAARPRPLEPSV